MSSEKTSKSLLPLFAFGVLLSIGVVVADRWMGSEIVRQWSTSGYAQTQGTVGTSFATSDRNGKRMLHRLIIGYNYTVDGQDYTSTQVSHGFKTSSRGDAESYAKRFALGSTVPVYYKPGDPSEAVLLPGLQGYSLLHASWLYALHLMALVVWYTLFRNYRRMTPGLDATVVDGRTHVPLSSGLDEAFILCAGLFLVSIVLYLVDSHPSLGLMGLFWASILGATVYVAIRRADRKKAGAFELILDERNGWLSVPPLMHDAAGVHVPLNQLRGSQIEEATRPGPNNTRVPCWNVLLIGENKGGNRQALVVASLDSSVHAEYLSAWLNRTCSRGPEESPSPAVA